MNDDLNSATSRRAFLKAAGASALALTGCDTKSSNSINISEAQLKKKFQGISTVALIKCQTYEEDIASLFKKNVLKANAPNLKGKTVVIKPNMVEYYPDRPVTTNASMVAATAIMADHLGASKIIIGEGPGHFRDTQFLLESTGIDKVCKKLGLPFVDLNLDDLEEIDNPDGFTQMKQIFLPRTIIKADAVISVPKLKTHHWVGVTVSMKNLFGTVPGRKYGWPKNILHWMGINHSIIDLVHLIKPVYAVVDAVVSMQGNGPISGTAKDSGFIAMGSDLAAVDSTCVRAMGINPYHLDYIALAGKVVGNIDSQNINIVGSSLDSIKQQFEMSPNFKYLTDKSMSRKNNDASKDDAS